MDRNISSRSKLDENQLYKLEFVSRRFLFYDLRISSSVCHIERRSRTWRSATAKSSSGFFLPNIERISTVNSRGTFKTYSRRSLRGALFLYFVSLGNVEISISQGHKAARSSRNSSSSREKRNNKKKVERSTSEITLRKSPRLESSFDSTLCLGDNVRRNSVIFDEYSTTKSCALSFYLKVSRVWFTYATVSSVIFLTIATHFAR